MAKQPIIEIIRTVDRGQVFADMQKGIDEIVEAIENARGAGVGELTLKLKIKSTSEGVFAITPALTVKVPQPARLDMITFLDDQSGELIRRDPRQPDLPAVVEADFANERRRAQTQEE
jgi:hypothetical protein